jgi:selenocysteine lyase/cysteine desulfurase
MCLKRAVEPHRTTLLMSDAEYPGVLSAAHEYWQGTIAVAQIAEHLWRGDVGHATEVLERAFLVTQPGVVFLSHVWRETGAVLDEKLLRFVRAVSPRAVIVLDGAQAVGNVCVSPEMLDLVDFYVASGHKWLCGDAPLGLVWGSRIWGLPDSAQGYSSRSGSAGTGSVRILRSVARGMRDFVGQRRLDGGREPGRMETIQAKNGFLADLFCNEVARALSGRAECVGHGVTGWKRNGIVTVRVRGAEKVARRLNPPPGGGASAYEVTLIERDAAMLDAPVRFAMGNRISVTLENGTERGSPKVRLESFDPIRDVYRTSGVVAIRYSVHYYHTPKDIRDAVTNLAVACSMDG